MIDIDLIPIGTLCNAIITSTDNPDILIPIKCSIVDIQLKEDIPLYKVRIITVYDNIDFINKYFIYRHFYYDYRKSSRKMKPPKSILNARNRLSNIGDFETWISADKVNHIIVPSIFVFKTKNEMLLMYNKIQEYLLTKHLKIIQAITTRKEYTGFLKMTYPSYFIQAMKRAFSVNFDTEESFKKYFDNI